LVAARIVERLGNPAYLLFRQGFAFRYRHISIGRHL
jgi:hypothetical protein